MGQNEMGPNSVWLTEFLTNEMKIEPGMRVLDLGCGKAMSSIFIAQNFDVEVWAADLWIKPSENFVRVKEFNLENSVYPILTEARNLPFAEEFFDVIISVDAFHYFGTDETYLPYFLKFVRPGGWVGLAIPGLLKEFKNGLPAYLESVWETELYTFHSAEWWKNHFLKTGLVEVLTNDYLENGWELWKYWEEFLISKKLMNPERGDDLALLKADKGRNLCFPRIIARKL